ncbi:hypothetical protein [Candidatus Methanarcanum hacksteinii]|uniref:hypothetical protein n=1 Tax=Candidatus Methanarcanum hacksteinii TaxID=2911857 RepID=UPI0037DD78D4
MNEEQEKLHEINTMSKDYKLYLVCRGKKKKDAEKAALSLCTLFWQAGEQMTYLREQIAMGIKDGKKFSMLVGLAYSILDSISAAADMSMIGEEIDDKNRKKSYIIRSDTHFIKMKKLYGKRTDENTNDFEYFRFLRSFICAHPLETVYSTTVDGFIPGKFAYCKFVEYVADNQLYHFIPSGADFYVQIIDNTRTGSDFFIKSSEVWQYVEYRFKELVNTIHSVMKERIEQTIAEYKNEPIFKLGSTPDIKQIDKLIDVDSERQLCYEYSLRSFRTALEHTFLHAMDPELNKELQQWIWSCVTEIHKQIQNMEKECASSLHSASFTLLKNIGFDSNQISNFSELDDHCYEECVFEEWGCIPTPNPEERSKEYHRLLSDNRIDRNDRGSCINLVSCYYVYTQLPKTEIARLFFVIVIPDFIEKYNLLDHLINEEDYSLYVRILACTIDWNIKNCKLQM